MVGSLECSISKLKLIKSIFGQEHTSKLGIIYTEHGFTQQLKHDYITDGFANAKARKVYFSYECYNMGHLRLYCLSQNQ
jgi:hypothetical protein